MVQGCVDWFHLNEELPTRDWATAYTENQRVTARVLYVNIKEKRVALTLKLTLVTLKLTRMWWALSPRTKRSLPPAAR